MKTIFLLFSLSVQFSRSELFGGHPLASSPPPWQNATHHILPGALWGRNQRAPFPTNVWWQNFVQDAEDGGMIVVPEPYILKATDRGLHVCLPKILPNTNVIFAGYEDNVILSAVEENYMSYRELRGYDDLSVTFSWSKNMLAPIVRGMPYTTVSYADMTPKLIFGSKILQYFGNGDRYQVDIENGQQWIIYSDSLVSFAISDEEDTLYMLHSYYGYLRVAAVMEGIGGDADTLDRHAKSIPTGGYLSASASAEYANMNFNYFTEGEGELLIMALPHHLDTISPGLPQTPHTIQGLKGEMVGISIAKNPVSQHYQMDFTEPLTNITWNSWSPVPDDKVEELKAALEYDIANEPLPVDDPYFGGKKMAVFARLSLIADQIGETEMAQQARAKVKPFLEGWLGGTNGNNLLYESSWGGLVSTCGLQDDGCDFGNGLYNDHHFHYGYHIYTAAVLARSDPEWGREWEERVLHMISDIAEPSRASPYYPFSRYKDWYAGHGWASGIYAFADGKNQESTSESVMAWYAIYLWGLASENNRLKDLGRLMTALEIRSAHKYWQMTTDDSRYPSPFADHKAVGIVWSDKVEYSTWFGGNTEFIHCIQMLPFLPISEELLREEWIREEYEVLKEVYDRPDPPLSEEWKGYVIMAHAVIDPQAAYEEALQLQSYDDGNTKSNTLWWISTRPKMTKF